MINEFHPFYLHPARGNVLGNTLGTLNNKKSPPTFPPLLKPKRKKLSPPEPSHWLQEISISKIVCHYFQPRLILPL